MGLAKHKQYLSNKQVFITMVKFPVNIKLKETDV
jgi:hypothetical protein